MTYLLNTRTGEAWKICRLCSSPMCWVETFDEEGWEDLWWHCHDCDMRNCDEETDED